MALLVPPADSSLAWEVRVDPGDAFVLASVRNRNSDGIGTFRLETFQRLAGSPAGKPWDPEALVRTEQWLLRSGYFERRAAGTWFRIPGRNQLRPQVDLAPLPANRLEVALVSNPEAAVPQGDLQLVLGNLWGSARSLSFGYLGTDSLTTMKLHGREPWLLGGPLDLLLGGGFDEQPRVAQRFWGEAGLALRGRVWEFSLWGGRELRTDTIGQVTGWWSRMGWERDTRDHPLFARHGTLWQQEFSWKRSGGGSLLVTQGSGEGRWLLPGGGWGVRVASGAGWRWPRRESFGREDLFALGGLRTVRGHWEEELRAVRMAWGQAEWIALVDKRLEWPIFLDAGLGEAEQVHSQRALLGWGFGLRSRTPTWGIEAYFAWDDRPELGRTLLHAELRRSF
jgi:hypothetical protein